MLPVDIPGPLNAAQTKLGIEECGLSLGRVAKRYHQIVGKRGYAMRACLTMCLVAVFAITVTVPTASADRVDELEKAIEALQKELTGLKSELSEMKTAPAASAGSAAGVLPEGVKAKVGADLRMRGVMMDNMWNFDMGGYDDSWEWERMRTRAWFGADLGEGMSGFFRGANEYKWGLDRKYNTLGIDPDFDALIGNKEFFVDNAYMDWAEPFGADWLTLRIGRQDLIYGEGFIILDGQSNVGSMAIAFDAVKATVQAGDETTIDLLYSKVQENDKNFADDEDLWGIYAKTDILPPVHLEPYLLYRNKNRADQYLPMNMPGGAADPTLPDAGTFVDPELETLMLGTRAVAKVLDGNLMLVGEGGYQWGEIQDPRGLAFLGTDSAGEGSVDRRAWAAYGYGQYTFNDLEMKPYVKAGYYLMSGDDPDTSKYEGWDSFYAEWPKFSEGLIYQLYDPFVAVKGTAAGVTDRDLGSWTNMRIAQLEAGFNPIPKLSLLGSYQYLWADEETSLLNPDEDERGQLLTAIASFQINKFLSGHLRGEYFIPGDYYDPAGGDDPDDAFFCRYQLMLKF